MLMARVDEVSADLDAIAAGVDSLEAGIKALKEQVANGSPVSQADLDGLSEKAKAIVADLADTSDQ